ncbi:MAG: peptidylprolyl isomerase [Alphaproteobacteria bacterium]|nr:peptidylprolyl isomerase [Alphaproteobacteria bacterium]
MYALKSSGLQDTPDLHQRMASQMLRQMIDEKLQIQNAKALGISATEGEIATRIAEVERAANMGRGSFKLFLQSIGVSFDVAKQQIEAAIDWPKIIRRRIRPQVDVTETEVDDALNRLRSNVGKTESHVAEIFIPVDRPEQADEGRRAAERVEEQLRRGAPFAALAQQFSNGQTAQAGGDLGWILPGSLDPTLDAAVARLNVRQPSEPIRTPAGWHILLVVDRRPFATARPDDVRLTLVQLTLALPVNASPDETNRATAEAQKAMAAVRQCTDLHQQARLLKGATSGELPSVRVGDLAANQQMYQEIPKLQIGGVAGPFRVAEGMQIVSLCSREGANGTLSRDAIQQQLMLQKLESAARRYMRDLRRTATIDVKQ